MNNLDTKVAVVVYHLVSAQINNSGRALLCAQGFLHECTLVYTTLEFKIYLGYLKSSINLLSYLEPFLLIVTLVTCNSTVVQPR